MKKLILNLFIFVVIFYPHTIVFAKTIANIISTKGEFISIDLTTDKKVRDGKLEGVTSIEDISPGDVVTDGVHNLLFVVNNSHDLLRIFVYDHKTLKQIKILDLVSDYGEEENAVKVFVAPTRSRFYVKWWDKALNNGNGGQVISIYNSETLEKIRDLTGILLAEKILVSNDGLKIYSLSDQETAAKVDVFASNTFGKIQTIDLDPIISPNIYGWSIDDFKNEKFLIVENDKIIRTELSKYIIYLFDLKLSTSSPKLKTGLRGSTFLFPNENKAALMEEKNISTTSLGKIISLGKIHIYDLNQLKQLGEITITNDPIGNILGVSNDGKKLLYYSCQFNGDNSKITIIDLTNYSIVTHIPAPIDSTFMTLYIE